MNRNFSKEQSLGFIRPDLVPFFVNKEQAFELTPYSHKRVLVQCPDCKTIREIRVADLTRSGFTCQVCSKFVSLPNRIIRQVMKIFQNEVEELQFEYHNQSILKGQSLDVFFIKDGQQYGIEMQGRQHDKRAQKSMYEGTLKTISEYDNDKRIKTKLANIIEIEIECNQTNMDYIKNQILNSELKDLFNFNSIDWVDIYSKSYKNIIKEVCDDYSTGQYIKDLANKYCIARTTIRDYLKRGRELGWCDYDEKLSESLGPKSQQKRVSVYDLLGNYESSYLSLSEAAKDLTNKESDKYYSNVIGNVCRGKQKYYKKHIFKFD